MLKKNGWKGDEFLSLTRANNKTMKHHVIMMLHDQFQTIKAIKG